MVRIHGFSLFELVVCLALLATIAATGALRVPDVLASLRLSGAVQRLSAALRQARGRALERGGPVEVRLDEGGALWELCDTGGATVSRETLPPGVTFAGLPASRRVRFSALGTTDNATVTLRGGVAVRSIVVNQRGRVRVQ
jgi:prepilin-type N-terminal cleavage/methylation domain-containing protein